MLQDFIDEIDAFLARTGMTETRFGISALGDPNFIFDLRSGRDVRLTTVERVRQFMVDYRPEEPPPCPLEAEAVA